MAHPKICKVNVNVLSCICSYLPVFCLTTDFSIDFKHGIFVFWIFHILFGKERKDAHGRQGGNLLTSGLSVPNFYLIFFLVSEGIRFVEAFKEFCYL